MFEKESAYFEENIKALRDKYKGRYVVISGDTLVGDYDSDETAYAGAIAAKLEPGEFMIKFVPEAGPVQVQRFTSLVYV
ncbi:MAG: hypothetical protein LBP80_02950 [Treponema sp.]|jgi:hypothetical protein|nr:hypothetical protein [Treponema sp.]